MIYLVFILLFFPVYFQYNFGNKALFGLITIKYWKICILSFIGEFIMTILSFLLMIKILESKGIKDGMPLGGIIIFGILISIIICILIIFQLIVKNRD